MCKTWNPQQRPLRRKSPPTTINSYPSLRLTVLVGGPLSFSRPSQFSRGPPPLPPCSIAWPKSPRADRNQTTLPHFHPVQTQTYRQRLTTPRGLFMRVNHLKRLRRLLQPLWWGKGRFCQTTTVQQIKRTLLPPDSGFLVQTVFPKCKLLTQEKETDTP